MRVACREHHAARARDRGMRHHLSHEPFSETLSAMRFEHVDVAEVRERRVIRDHARKTDLAPGRGFVDAEAQRVLRGALDGLERNARRPVRARQVFVHRAHVESRGVGGNLVRVHQSTM
jgi:hypothetical protein